MLMTKLKRVAVWRVDWRQRNVTVAIIVNNVIFVLVVVVLVNSHRSIHWFIVFVIDIGAVIIVVIIIVVNVCRQRFIIAQVELAALLSTSRLAPLQNERDKRMHSKQRQQLPRTREWNEKSNKDKVTRMKPERKTLQHIVKQQIKSKRIQFVHTNWHRHL